jgi:hypothetical protein
MVEFAVLKLLTNPQIYSRPSLLGLVYAIYNHLTITYYKIKILCII